jgi:hypothetical protein
LRWGSDGKGAKCSHSALQAQNRPDDDGLGRLRELGQFLLSDLVFAPRERLSILPGLQCWACLADWRIVTMDLMMIGDHSENIADRRNRHNETLKATIKTTI